LDRIPEYLDARLNGRAAHLCGLGFQRPANWLFGDSGSASGLLGKSFYTLHPHFLYCVCGKQQQSLNRRAPERPSFPSQGERGHPTRRNGSFGRIAQSDIHMGQLNG
jgi:hypothetical protein